MGDLQREFTERINQLKEGGLDTEPFEREFAIYSKYAVGPQNTLKGLLIQELFSSDVQELNNIRRAKYEAINRYFNNRKEAIIGQISEYGSSEPLQALIRIDNEIQTLFDEIINSVSLEDGDQTKTDLFLLGIEVYQLQENTLLWLSRQIVPGASDDIKRLLNVMLDHLIIMDRTIETVYRENIS